MEGTLNHALLTTAVFESATASCAGRMGSKAIVIELTEQQAAALERPDATPPRVLNTRTREAFVLLRADEYARLTDDEYDDSPWTREELQALAWERVEHEDGSEYNNPPGKP